MSRKFEDIESELLQLDPVQRAALAKTLLASLDDLSEAEYDRLWGEEAEARYADFVAGVTESYDGEEVFAELRARRR